MATGIAAVVERYNHIMEHVSDPRTKDWPLMASPLPLVSILAGYLYFCTTAGPRYMEHRKPFNLRSLLLWYNAAQVAFSVWLFYEGLQGGWLRDYSYKCQPVDYSQNPVAVRMAQAVWWYFVAKLVELLDTVFFILRKKNNQVSYLHLYHHTMMPICGWIGVKFLPGGHGTFLGVINSFVHIVMYLYYFLSGLGPEYQKYLWWKKYLTTMQMVQFVFVFLHSCQLFIYDCNYPKAIVVLLSVNALYFLYLFGSFYRRTYISYQKSRRS